MNGRAPNADTDALLGAGAYTVSLAAASASVRSLTIGSGATLSLSSGGSLEVERALTNYGSVSMTGGELTFLADGVLENLGAIHARTGGNPAYIDVDNIINTGSIDNAVQGHVGALSILTGKFSNEEDGTLSAIGGGWIKVQGSVENRGEFEARDGGYLDFSSAQIDTIVDFAGKGVLVHGAWTAVNGSIDISSVPIAGLVDATVRLGGSGSIVCNDGQALHAIQDSLERIDADSRLELTNSFNYVSTAQLELLGVLSLSTSTLAGSGSLTSRSGSLVTGDGDITKDVDLSGDVRGVGNGLVFTGDARFAGRLLGSTVTLGDGADTLEATRLPVANLMLTGADVTLGATQAYVGHLSMTGGSLDVSTHRLVLSGDVDLDGGEIRGGAGGYVYLKSAAVEVDGDITVSANLVNASALVVKLGSTVEIQGKVGGQGGITVADSVLEFGSTGSAGKHQHVSLDHGTLVLDHASGFSAVIEDFTTGDVIDLTEIDSAHARIGYREYADGSGGVLIVTDGHDTAKLRLHGEYQAGDFHLSADGAGGTDVTTSYAPAAADFVI